MSLSRRSTRRLSPRHPFHRPPRLRRRRALVAALAVILAATSAVIPTALAAPASGPGERGAASAPWPGFVGVPEPGETLLFRGSRYFAADDTVHGEEL